MFNIFKNLFLSLSLVFMFLGANITICFAVDYQTLAVEQRQVELRNKSDSSNAQQATREFKEAFDKEKELIQQQLTVITGDEDTRSIIVNGDTLQVTYLDQGKPISNNYQVNGNGEITLALIGTTKVSGLNRGQAREHLNTLLKEYIRNPELTVEINISGKYTVLGAAGPGVYSLEPNLMMLEAVIKAGYQPSRANLSNILVMRGSRDKPEILKLNLKKMMLKGDRGDNIPVKPNDLIYIPNTLFYDFDNFKDKMFEYLADYYTLGAATILTPKKAKNNLSDTAQ